jgi:predicted transposase YbfD/YdcC
MGTQTHIAKTIVEAKADYVLSVKENQGHLFEDISVLFAYVRYYITSLFSDAEKILHAVRKHWSIENKLHWVLDVALNEDHCRVRKDQAPENLAVLRHIALNLLKQEKAAKGGIHAKQLQAAWNDDYLLKVLASGI